MHTQCPTCATVFEVSASDLGSAAGLVRCSRCHDTFNALETLRERPPGDTRPHQMPLEIPDGEPPRASGDPDSDPDVDAEPGVNDTDRESTRTAYAQPIAAEPADPEPAAADVEAESQDPATADETDPEAERPPDDEEGEEGEDDEEADEAVDGETDIVHESAAGIEDEIDDEVRSALRGEIRDAIRVAVVAAHDDGATDTDADIDELRRYLGPKRPSAWQRVAWTFAGLALILALGVQMLHHWRGAIVRHPTLGPHLERLYAAAGLPLDPHYDLTAYYWIESPRVQVDTTVSPGLLRVVGALASSSPRPQPHPWIRITVKDRWGEAVGSRSFEPAEYLATVLDPIPLLESERLARIEFLIVEPQLEADGFDVDLCLRDAAGLTRCKDDP